MTRGRAITISVLGTLVFLGIVLWLNLGDPPFLYDTNPQTVGTFGPNTLSLRDAKQLLYLSLLLLPGPVAIIYGTYWLRKNKDG